MGQSIRRSNYEEVKALQIPKKSLIFNPRAEYWAFFDGEHAVSVLAVREAKNGLKLQANYTIPEFRNRGIFSALLRYVISEYPDKDFFADCLKSSVSIYLKNGFELQEIKEFKSFTIYKVRLKR